MSNEIDPKEVGNIGAYLFDRYLEDKKIPRDNIPDLQPADFLAWLASMQISELELSLKLGVSEKSCAFVLGLAHDPAGVNRLIVMWPYLILKHRKMKYPLQSMQLFLVLHWRDQVVAPLSVYIHQDALIGGSVLDDAAVCGTVTQNSDSLLRDIKSIGLDGIHDKQSGNGIFAAPRIIQLTQDIVNGVVKRNEVPDSDIAAVNQLLLFVSTMFPSDLPDHIKEAVAAGNRQAIAEAAEASDAPDAPSDGGFPNPN
jgi:hypothetical protein